MAKESGQVTAVQICNQTYQLRSGDDPEHVRKLARYVDQRMNEVFERTPTVDSLKVAVLTALNIADEYFSLQREMESIDGKVLKRAEKLNALLEPFVESESS